MTARILAGSVFDMLPTIMPGSVDCVVTSPPYWMLRSYLPKGHELKAQELGSEPTVQEFIANMVRVFGLVRDCMADHGTCWLNMGDTYAAERGGTGMPAQTVAGGVGGKSEDDAAFRGMNREYCANRDASKIGMKHGSLCLIPQRLAIALQDDGWIIRSVIVWHKPAPMPASVSGWMWKRCRVKVKGREIRDTKSNDTSRNGHARQKGHPSDANAQWSDCPGCEKCEKNAGLVLRRGSWRPTSSWEPILMLAKSPNYYADGEAVKTPASQSSGGYQTRWRNGLPMRSEDSKSRGSEEHGQELDDVVSYNGTANPRDVQTWASEPLKEKHYAAFPTALVRFFLRAGTSLRGYCPTCGAPWARIVESGHYEPEIVAEGVRNVDASRGDRTRKINGKSEEWKLASQSTTLGWKPTCRCPEQEPRPGLVLDPFAGSGRTLLTAQRMGLDAVGCELNPEYIAMARKILRDDSPLFTQEIANERP